LHKSSRPPQQQLLVLPLFFFSSSSKTQFRNNFIIIIIIIIFFFFFFFFFFIIIITGQRFKSFEFWISSARKLFIGFVIIMFSKDSKGPLASATTDEDFQVNKKSPFLFPSKGQKKKKKPSLSLFPPSFFSPSYDQWFEVGSEIEQMGCCCCSTITHQESVQSSRYWEGILAKQKRGFF
jgi:hypothetical protein